MKESPERIRSLDGLRGAAALAVLLHHSLLVVPGFDIDDQGVNATPLHVFWAGREAVYIFFILSGFVLTVPAVSNRIRWRAYYPSRLVRLYLPVVAAVVIGWIITSAFPRVHETGQSAWMQTHQLNASPLTYVRDAFLLTGTSNVNTPLWSLQWEVTFSLLLPAYTWAAMRLRSHWVLSVAVSLVASTAGAALHVAPLLYLPMFFIGSLLAVRAAHSEDVWRGFSVRRGSVFFAAAVFGITSVYWASPVIRFGVGTTTLVVVVASAAMLVVLAIGWGPLRAALTTRFIQWAGRVSFSLYLTHELIVVSVGQLLPSSLAWLTPLIAIPVAIVVALLFFRFVEAPAHQLSKQISRRLRPQGAVSGAVAVARGGS